MLIKNTKHESTFPWPEGIFIQGGEHGVVFGRTTPSYRTAFVEVGPEGTFIRGEGATIAEAEEEAWRQYEIFMKCDGTGVHGPFEPRKFENGAGYCTRCGTWMPRVLEPSLGWRMGEEATGAIYKRYGDEIMWHPRKSALVKEEKAILMAEALGEPIPERLVEPPTEAELEALRKEESQGVTTEELAEFFRSIGSPQPPAEPA